MLKQTSYPSSILDWVMQQIYCMNMWKKIKEYAQYSISKGGKVKRDGRLLKLCKGKAGYFVFNVSKDGKVKQKYLHRELAKLFIKNPNPNEFTEINHIDGNKTNNSLNNLEWCSGSMNMKHAVKNGLRKYPKGKDHWCYGKTRFELFGN